MRVLRGTVSIFKSLQCHLDGTASSAEPVTVRRGRQRSIGQARNGVTTPRLLDHDRASASPMRQRRAVGWKRNPTDASRAPKSPQSFISVELRKLACEAFVISELP